MKRWTTCVAVAVALSASGAQAQRPEEGVSKKADLAEHDVPGTIIEHVSDSDVFELDVPYPDAKPILKEDEVVGYRRGDARIHIDVDTGSGGLVLEPHP